MACRLSNLKQLFARGSEFAYSLEDFGHYYQTYRELTRHWHAVFPDGSCEFVTRTSWKDLKQNVRRILEFCVLTFKPACVEFYETDRAVSTARSEQVHRPIFRDGLHQRRHYEPWVTWLEDGSGAALIRYRE